MLFRKMLRDIAKYKIQFISILLMAFLSAMIYFGTSAMWYGWQVESDKYLEETNAADMWLYSPYLDYEGFSEKDIADVKAIDGVTDATRRLRFEGIARLPNQPTLVFHFVEDDVISKCHLMEGEPFSVSEDGLWLDYLFAQEHGIKVGDTVAADAYGFTAEKVVRGLVFNPEYIYQPGKYDVAPNHANMGFAFLSERFFPRGDKAFKYTELLIKLDSNANAGAVEKQIEASLSGRFSELFTRDNLINFSFLKDDILQHKSMAEVFPIAFLAVAILTILTTMTRIVNNQYTQIGTLKALGFKKKKILLHYVSYGFFISGIGCLLGTLAGPITMPNLFYGIMETEFSLPVWQPIIAPVFLIVPILVVAVCTLATFMSCRSILHDTPAESLRPRIPKKIKHSGLEKTKFWSKLSFNLQWNIRDSLKSKTRSIMAVVGSLGCVALLICALGMQDGRNDILKWQFEEINKYETKLVLAEKITAEQLDAVTSRYNGESIMEDGAEIRVGEAKRAASITVLDHNQFIQPVDENRSPITLPNDSVSISQKLANDLNVSIGDKITWHVYGDARWSTTKIGGIYRVPFSQGIMIPRTLFEELGHQYLPTSVLTNETDIELIDGIVKSWSADDLVESYKASSEATEMLIYILIAAAIALAIIVLYNLGVLSFTEKLRDLATLKALGFKTGKIRALLLTQNMFFSIIGTALGIPCGTLLIDIMNSTVGNDFDAMTIISVPTLVISVGLTLFMSVLVNYMFTAKIKRIDMVSTLKGVD